MGAGLPPRGGSLRPPSPRAAEAPARATEAAGGAAPATPVVATTSAEPPRKRKRGFSTLR
jgi:hypothetical protein